MSRRILVIDDQADLRLLIRLSLRSLGQIEQASSAVQAQQMIDADPPDLVVLDIWLGNGPSGLELCRSLRAQPRTRILPVLLLSANGQQSDIAAGMKAGANAYVVKPFSPDELLAAAARLLAR